MSMSYKLGGEVLAGASHTPSQGSADLQLFDPLTFLPSGHQGTLVSRPAYESLGDLATVITRLGHILAGASQMDSLLKAGDAVVEEIFDYRPVLRLPDEAAAWRSDASWALEASVLAGAITREDAKAILDHDNSSWRSVRYTHYCLVGGCPSGCRNENDSKEKAKLLLRTSLSPGCPIALLYRWKHMTNAQAFAERGRGEHEVLTRALQKMWTKNALQDAVAEAEAAANVDELSFQTRTAAKAASVLRFFEQDVGSQLLVRGQVLASPPQVYVNKIMQADKAMIALYAANALDPAGAAARDCMLECQRLNFRFLSGLNGRLVVQTYSDMLYNLEHPRWQASRLPEAFTLESAVKAG